MGDVQYIIKLPKGIKATSIENLSSYKDEREVLIDNGALFDIKHIELEKTSKKGKKMLVFLEYLNKELK